MRPRTAVVVAALTLLGCLTAAAGALAAGPARYVLEKCDAALPGGGTAGAVFTGPAPYTPGNNCSEAGGALIILQGGPVTTGSSYWSLPLPPPPGGSVESVTVTAQICNGTNHDPGTVGFAVQGGWPLTCTPEVRTFSVNSTAGSAGMLYLGCNGSCERDPFVWAHYFAATEADPVPPIVLGTEGSLLAGGPMRGHQTLGAVAHDEGGGVSKVSVLVNGLAAAPPLTPLCQTAQVANTSVVGTVATTAAPCPAEARASWTLDTAESPFRDGANTVQVCAFDFATLGEPNQGCSLPQSVAVNNSCPESPILGGEVLDVRFARSKAASISVPYGKGAKLAGKLADQAGDPIAGATICVEARTEGSRGGVRPLATTSTDARGHFTYRLGAGPDRRVLVGYRHDSFQVAQTIRFHARTRPRLHVWPPQVRGGGAVRITGRLPGPRAAGRVVVLQASALHGRRWLTFRRATTGHRGGFAATYRFGATSRTTTYRMRALVPRQRGYPYEPGHSRPARVKVAA